MCVILLSHHTVPELMALYQALKDVAAAAALAATEAPPGVSEHGYRQVV